MAARWPFAGRAALVEAVRSARGAVIVAGPAGVGKSRLVAEAVDGPGVAWVRATAAAAEIPLGAFAHLLPAVAPGGNPLGWAAAALRAPALIVDDAHLLDPVSASLVHHLVTRGGIKVVGTVRSGEPAPDAIVSLWKDDLATRIDVAPLSPDEAGLLLEGALGGRVEATTSRRLWEVSGGNPLYLRELVLSGMLADVGGLWLWRGRLSLTATLRETIEARLGVLADDERAALEFLAYGEPLGADLLAGLTGERVVARLEDRQLVTARSDGARLEVRLAHPLYGEVVADRCGALRTRAVLRALADAVTATGMRRRADVLRVAMWRLDAGQVDDVGLLAAAAEQARGVRDLELAERLARAAVAADAADAADADGPATGELLVLLGRVLAYQGRYAEADEALRAAWAKDLTFERRVECGVARAEALAWGLGHLDEAKAVLARVVERLARPEDVAGASIIGAAIDAAAGDLVSARALLEGTAGLSEYHLDRARGVGWTALLYAEGRPREALAAADQALAVLALDGAPRPSLSLSVVEYGLQACLLLGDLDGADAWLARGEDLHGGYGSWHRAIVLLGAHSALVRLLRGRPRESAACAADASVFLRGLDHSAGVVLGRLAHARALLGDADGAARALAECETRALRHGPAVNFPIRLARAWTAAARGDLVTAVDELLDLAAGSDALPAQVPFALHDVVRLGRPELVADRLAGLGIESPLVALFARHAAACDPRELQEVSQEFERLGMILHAAEAAAQAAGRFAGAGLNRSAQAARTRAVLLAQQCPGARTPALVGLAAPDLTARQLEIAQLAASGLTNREIADRLVVSIRTVANTLVAVYEKVGVNDRAALAELLGELWTRD
ncbi:hypothetical protein J5X84_31885 [Streptosporangiaceae bacterium NEAU-GS5]|nr:hypothetical protein [Streptosporangiaceae bacterium NEAU-GS5]